MPHVNNPRRDGAVHSAEIVDYKVILDTAWQEIVL